jgi:hypothetical protein
MLFSTYLLAHLWAEEQIQKEESKMKSKSIREVKERFVPADVPGKPTILMRSKFRLPVK